MTKTTSKTNLKSDEELLLISGAGVAINALLTTITLGMTPSSMGNTIEALSISIIVIGALTAVASVLALIKVRLVLKVIPVIYIILTAGMAFMAYFNLWWI